MAMIDFIQAFLSGVGFGFLIGCGLGVWLMNTHVKAVTRRMDRMISSQAHHISKLAGTVRDREKEVRRLEWLLHGSLTDDPNLEEMIADKENYHGRTT